jgi:S1-C subfamily serine protease
MNRLNFFLFVLLSLLLILLPNEGEAQSDVYKRKATRFKVRLTLGQRPREADLPITTAELRDGGRVYVWVRSIRVPGQSLLKVGDVILKFNGQSVDSKQALRQILKSSFVGSRVSLEILRNRKVQSIKVPLLVRRRRGVFGVEIEVRAAGIYVAKVLARSAAARAGWKTGDRISFIGKNKIAVIDDVNAAMGTLYEGDEVSVSLSRSGHIVNSKVRLGAGPIPPFLGLIYKQKDKSRIVIDEVVKLSPAERVAIQAGDIICAIDGKEVKSAEGLQAIVDEYSPGDTVTVTVERRARKEPRLY